MTTRILPPEEWHKLDGSEAEPLYPLLNPETAQVVVVEDGDRIVGCHVLMWVLHAECLWIHPHHRGKSSVGRRLWDAVQRTARRAGVHALMTAACDDTVRGLLAHVGAQQVPGEHFMVPLTLMRTR